MSEEPPSVIDKEPAKNEFVKGESSDIMDHPCFREMIRSDEMCMDLNVLKRGMEFLEESERLEFDRRWKKLKAQEAKLRVQRAELLEEHLDLILMGLQGSS
ncbi:hypothetical protein TSUD_242870 [Trifolium subterraneum]|uniref:Uncharacterized protein n=1 Tax=Trifolium subterraneum TaxID=3900 RepID=A0A2Z6PNG4_TRISU|nr:hypothetical protein TSUD_242870 [Trifolium subterraneum]